MRRCFARKQKFPSGVTVSSISAPSSRLINKVASLYSSVPRSGGCTRIPISRIAPFIEYFACIGVEIRMVLGVCSLLLLLS